ncbi:MAG: GlsB/YeaQ/YmgE family stress response membrane protein [Hyphomicrobiales bacterium]|nr:MAG: GlsB/YeaQ/YmgE family stress response membrane protein [Hyphomicrobiales bacterium]
MGWIMTIILGGIAGFIAEKIMKADMGMLANIGIGILGAVVMNFILNVLGVNIGGGLLISAITAIAGACLLIFVYRAVRSRG